MTGPKDPVPHWTRLVSHLRTQALKRGRDLQPASNQIVDDALEACDGLLRDLAGARLECERLEAEVRSGTASWERLFETIPVACVLTDGVGSIVDANRAAGVLLNLAARRLKERQLLLFSEDREAFDALLHQLARGAHDQHRARVTFRPRERRPSEIDALIVPLSGEPSTRWVWFLTPAQEPHAIDAETAHALVSATHES
jgi:PAS domain S-box-containing protein